MSGSRLRPGSHVRDPYTRRILANVIGKEPLRVLAGTPRRLASMVDGLSARQLRKCPAQGKWSITHLLCHLSDTEVVLAFRLRMAIAESGTPLQSMNEQKWARHLGYETGNVRERLLLFTALRRDTLRLLRGLPDSSWNRYGVHEERGKETVTRIARMYAGHDVNHLRQIRDIRKQLLTR